MGCGCLSANEKKPQTRQNNAGMTVNKGGVKLGGEAQQEDVAAARAARFEAQREQ